MELETFYSIMIGVLSAAAMVLTYTIGNYNGYKEANKLNNMLGCGK